MILYLLKMIACSAAFYALYHFVFRHEKMLVFNRFYLLASLVATYIIPLITFTVYVPQRAQTIAAYDIGNAVITNVETGYSLSEYFIFSAMAICVLITVRLAIRFISNLWKINKTIRQHNNVMMGEAKLVLLDRTVVPHSFMSYIFIGRSDYEQGRVQEVVLLHELAHVRQKHSWDILFIELLQVLSWFNPVIYLFKRAIKINHEFLADEAVVNKNNDRVSYQQLLLQSVYVNNNIPLASSFYFFTTKKRMIMLQKTFKRKRAVWAGMAALPLLALLIFTFSSRTYAQVKKQKVEKVTVQDMPQTSAVPDNVLSTEIHYDKYNNPLSASIEYKDGKVINEDISTPDKQKTFENKYNLKVIAGSPPLLEYETDSFSAMATKIIFRSSKDVSITDTITSENKNYRVIKPFNRHVIKDPEAYTPGKARMAEENKNQLGPAKSTGYTIRNSVRHVLNDEEVKKEPQSKLREETIPQYDQNGNKMLRLQIIGTKEEEEWQKARILTSTEGRSNSDIKEILVQYDELEPKQYALVTYNDNKCFTADISTPKKKRDFEQKFNVKLTLK